MTTHRFAVFEVDGNRFIAPLFSYEVDDHEGRQPCDVILAAGQFSVVTGCKRPAGEDGWLQVEADENGVIQLHHRPMDLRGRVFEHGGCTVYCIAGPVLDGTQTTGEFGPGFGS